MARPTTQAQYEGKKWNPIFSEKRIHSDDLYMQKGCQNIEMAGDQLSIFLRGGFERVPLWESDVVENFCRDCRPSRAWIDDLEVSTGRRRHYREHLSLEQLRKALRLRRFGHENLPNADRRLIYISNLTPDFVRALVETATLDTVETLRDTIAKHIASETSIKASILPQSSLVFQLELHFPYLALRESSRGIPARVDADRIIEDVWADVNFLNISSAHSKESSYHIITESRISVVIFGQDHYKWIGYAFVKGFQFDEDIEEAEDGDADDCGDTFEENQELKMKETIKDAPKKKAEEEHMSCSKAIDIFNIHDAHRPILDPRECWLSIVETRLRSVLREWAYLVQKITTSITVFISEHPSSLVTGPSHTNKRDTKRISSLLDWTIQTMHLLRELRAFLSLTIRASEKFQAPDGDQCYFSDITDEDSILAMRSINESFNQLTGLENKLSALDRSCEVYGKIIILHSDRLHLETSKLTSMNARLRIESGEWNFETMNPVNERDVLLLFLTPELRHVLMSTHKHHIWVTSNQEVSMENKIKAWIEDQTQAEWNWWPMEQRKRILRTNESGIFWRCSCGMRRWEEISTEQSEAIKEILQTLDDEPCEPSLCRTKKRAWQLSTLLNKKVWISFIHFLFSSISAAAQKYTPPTNLSSDNSNSPDVPLQHRATSSSQFYGHGGPATTQQVCAPSTESHAHSKTYILFGAQGSRRTLIPGQIPVDEHSSDSSIFRDFRLCYQECRGRMRLWFSIWLLNYCEVVKFSRLASDRMVSEYRDLPTDNAYEYSPRSGDVDVRNPPISPHIFQALFYTCCSPCQWPFPHDCFELPDGDRLLKPIPKRKNYFKKDTTSPIWGLEVVFEVSFVVVFLYHCLMVVIPFAFFGWWIHTHPDDLQDALVPVTFSLGTLSLFWSSAGILASKHTDGYRYV